MSEHTDDLELTVGRVPYIETTDHGTRQIMRQYCTSATTGEPPAVSDLLSVRQVAVDGHVAEGIKCITHHLEA